MILPGLGMERAYVLALRNDPEIIARGVSGHTVGPEWLDTGRFYVIYEPVGYMRVDEGEVSIAVEYGARGQGIASRALRSLADREPGITARVKVDNHASLWAFRKAGFDEVERRSDLVLLRAAR